MVKHGLWLMMFLIGGNVFGSDDYVPVRVIEQTYFVKKARPEISLQGGLLLNETYLTTGRITGKAGFYFNDFWGVELSGAAITASDNAEKEALGNLRYPSKSDPTKEVGIEPEINQIHSSFDLAAIFVPIYGKVSLLSKAILYSDLFFTAGVGLSQTDQGGKVAFTTGIGQHYFVTKSWSIRLDFKNYAFWESKKALDTDYLRSSVSFSLGASVFL